MKITYIGHACFKLEAVGATIVIDPYADDYVPGLKPVREKADLVLCSHGHKDHNCAEAVELSGRAPEDLPVRIEYIDTWHDDEQGAKRGPNRIHILYADGLKVVHFGDLGCELTADQLEKLSGADCIMIPVGGFYTIDGHQAASVTARLSPQVTIPMHFRGETFGYDAITTAEDFLDHFVDVEESGSSAEISAGGCNRIVLLSPLNK